MERYVFFDPHHVPPGLHVLGVPPAHGVVWRERTASEYDAAGADAEVARDLAGYAGEVLTCRWPTAREHPMEGGEVRQPPAADKERRRTVVKEGLST
jgi:hypothetical protein